MSYFNGSEGEAITLKEAAAYTANYRNESGKSAEAVRAHFFGSEILQKMLDQEGCVGLRMYYGRDEAGHKQLVLVGVAADGQDMEAGIVADRSKTCPPDCSSGTLNG